MTFDPFGAIDRKFRKPTIRLECVGCGSTTGVETYSSSYEASCANAGITDPAWTAGPRCASCRTDYRRYWDNRWTRHCHGRV